MIIKLFPGLLAFFTLLMVVKTYLYVSLESINGLVTSIGGYNIGGKRALTSMTLIALTLTMIITISSYAKSPMQNAVAPVASPIPTPSITVSPTAVVTTTSSPTPTSTLASTSVVTNVPSNVPTPSAPPAASESAQPQSLAANPTLTGALIVGLIAVALMIGIYYVTRRM